MTLMRSPQPPPEGNADRLDVALRANLVATPPPDLTARLLQLAQAPAPASRFDKAVQSAVVLDPPPELTARLLALVPQPAPVVVAKPTPGWIKILYAVTALALGVLIVVSAQFFQQLLAQAGAAELWAQLSSIPSAVLERVYVIAPRAHLVIEFYQALQRPLQWLLVGLVLWAVLEMASIQRRQLA